MANKRISATAVSALKEAISSLYWYKRDLRGFLFLAISRKELLAGINWDDYKRNIISGLVDQMASRQEVYQQDLLDLISEVSAITDFSHLRRLAGGEEMARTAQEAIEALRRTAQGYQNLVEEKVQSERRRREAQERVSQRQGFSARLSELRSEYAVLAGTDDTQARGYALEKLMRELFDLFDLDPRASFRIEGEQIDGSLSRIGAYYTRRDRVVETRQDRRIWFFVTFGAAVESNLRSDECVSNQGTLSPQRNAP